ncbi:unnamed protein product [Paramecium octaurelia]|uniref:Transmembrane protein n=1 Tax=Paramecium octaurelia TaxID=43137 RepID=A0A8S1YME7_PAROT|nr:unnamed protein product [Paramecium octaurelia]
MMIIFLVILIINICAYKISEQVFSLYPTEGEFYQNYLSDFIKSEQLSCKMYPKVPNVKVINQCEEILRTKGYQFKSMSSNTTHFSTLSKENEVCIYEWRNSIIQLVWKSVEINQSFNCFNINLSKDFQVLVDCYYDDKFFLIQFIDGQSTISYSQQSSVPASTKIQSILNDTNAFLVYAQYFENYSILSLISSQFFNLSSLNNQFVDFDITITISPNIYVISSLEIFQLSISPEFQFYYKYNFSNDNKDDMSNFISINAYYDLSTYSQCDQILLQYIKSLNSQIDYKMAKLLGCGSKIIKLSDSCPFKNCQFIQNILQNNQFIIYQSMNDRCIYNKQEENKLFFYQLNQSNSLLYFNDNNELFQFNQEIVVYKVSVPSIQINLTNITSLENFYNFTVMCINYDETYSFSLININLYILTNQDTNIYVISNYGFKDYQFSDEASGRFLFYGFSGQLLNYILSKKETYFNVTQVTFQNVGNINYNYQFEQFLSINYPLEDERQYLIGYTNQSLDILTCIYKYNNNSYEFTIVNSINISVNASSLQVANSIYPNMLIIGLSTNHTIYLFQYLNDSNSIINYSNYTFKQKFQDFVVTYNSIIILIKTKQEIKIMTFNFTNIFTLDQQSVNKLFNNIQFNPIQIVVNTQLLSSFLYINNINEVIIISIDQNSFPIPISLIRVDFTIKQINLVGQQLILSYLCVNEQNICFQVWNVQNLPEYYYVKNLYTANFDNNIIIQSDNLFFYVTLRNYTVYVYNPQLPYHMSLYYKLELTAPFQCTQSSQLRKGYIYEKSIIFSNNKLYYLFGQQNFNLTYQYYNQVYNNSISYPQLTYNYTITSALNDTAFQYTPNQTVTFYSNFTIFQNQSYLSINLTNNSLIPYSKNITYPISLILDRQMGYCGSINQNQTYDLNKYCSLTSFYHKSNSTQNQGNYSLITSINNKFFALQNNSYIQTLNGDLTNKFNLSYLNLNLSECLKSTAQNYTLYTICQNSTSQYLLNFTLNFSGSIELIQTTQLPKMFINISKISSVLNQIFVLGSIDQQQKQQLYWLDQSNNPLQLISDTNSACQDFSVALIVTTTSTIKQKQQIILFYIHQVEKVQSLFYTLLIVQNNQITVQNSVFIKGYVSNNENSRAELPPSYVLIIQTYQNRAIILLSNFDINYISEIIDFRIQQNLFQTVPIRTLPNYGNLNNTGNSFYQNGVLMQQFLSKKEFIVGVYFLNNLLQENLLEPILMQGSFTTTMFDYAMIVDEKYQNGTSLYIKKQSIHNYSISTWNVTCILNRKTQNYITVSIFCSNEFSNGTYIVTFKQPQLEKSSRRWIYSLISIIALLLLYFYMKVKQKTRNLDFNAFQIEL